MHHTTPDGRGPPILFVHGFGSSGEMWFRFNNSLGNSFISKGLDCWTLSLSNAIYANILDLARDDLFTSLDLIYRHTQQKIVIVAHSMGGIITRVLTSSNFKHPYDLTQLEEIIQGIALLAVPNHGIQGPPRIDEILHIIQKVLGRDSIPDLGLGFVQLTHESKLIKQLNRSPLLNPHIKWLNAVGTHDWVVPVDSALFSSVEVNHLPFFKQQTFPCDHMVYPFDKTLRRASFLAQKAIPDTPDSTWTKLESFVTLHPAIHRSNEVGNWILKELLPDISYFSSFQNTVNSKYGNP